MKNLFFLIVTFLIINACKSPTNWDQYLGPDRNATVSNADILRSWPDVGPTKLWEFPLGKGYGGAAVFDGEVFVLDRKVGESDILRCINIADGKEKWNFEYEAKGELPYPGSRAVPTVDNKHVWTVGPHGHFYCIDKKTHQAVWKKDLQKEYEAKLPRWGFSQSPLLYRNSVIVAPQGLKAGVTAFNKTTGQVIWESRPLTGLNSYVSPTIANYGGVDQVMILSPYHRGDSTITNEVAAFDVNTGKELWTYKGLRSFGVIAPVTVIDEKRLFLTDCSYNGNYKPVSIMLEITKDENGFDVNELFLTEETGCKMHPSVLFEDHLYLNNNGRPNQLTCLTLDGKLAWEKDSAPGFELGSLILIDGLIINQNGKNGDIHLIEPSPDGYKELGKASFFDSEKPQAWAPLAFYDGKLLFRDMEKMVCVDLQK